MACRRPWRHPVDQECLLGVAGQACVHGESFTADQVEAVATGPGCWPSRSTPSRGRSARSPWAACGRRWDLRRRDRTRTRRPHASGARVTTNRSPLTHVRDEPAREAVCPDPRGSCAAVRRRISPELWRLGLLTVLELQPLAAYCVAYARWLAAEETLAKMADADSVTHGWLIRTVDGNPRANRLESRAHALPPACAVSPSPRSSTACSGNKTNRYESLTRTTACA